MSAAQLGETSRTSSPVPSTARSAGISVEKLTKRFGRVTALDEVSLQVAPHEVVVLLGTNGAGKSTLLRIIGTTVLPDAGTILVGGHDAVTDPRAVRRSIGLLIGEERSWYWRLTGRENLEFFATLYGIPRRRRRERAVELLSECGLSDAAERRFSDYSSGMRLRLSLARALLTEPPVLLLDEPTRTLDPIATRRFREQLLALVERRGTAVMIATHDLHEAAEVGNRVVVLRSGRLSDPPRRLSTAAELEELLER
jgi:ABC-2 type transport system ATP-binding protein